MIETKTAQSPDSEKQQFPQSTSDLNQPQTISYYQHRVLPTLIIEIPFRKVGARRLVALLNNVSDLATFSTVQTFLEYKATLILQLLLYFFLSPDLCIYSPTICQRLLPFSRSVATFLSTILLSQLLIENMVNLIFLMSILWARNVPGMRQKFYQYIFHWCHNRKMCENCVLVPIYGSFTRLREVLTLIKLVGNHSVSKADWKLAWFGLIRKAELQILRKT